MLSHTSPYFLSVSSRSLLKTLWEKEKLLTRSNSSFTHSIFYLFGEPSAIFIKLEIIIYKLLVWKSKICLWERVGELPSHFHSNITHIKAVLARASHQNNLTGRIPGQNKDSMPSDLELCHLKHKTTLQYLNPLPHNPDF